MRLSRVLQAATLGCVLRVAAIDFLNPAPLMWDFLHPPHANRLAEGYSLHFTHPSECARELVSGEADLGLIPIAALTPGLLIVPGCTIASLNQVRSIQLIVKAPLELAGIKSVAADLASRSSTAYAEVILKHFYQTNPTFQPAPASPVAMLREHDAALLIGDPALLALEHRAGIEAEIGPCVWHDLAALWTHHTELPWVAAVWAIREDIVLSRKEREQLFLDLNTSRRNGLEHIPQLVEEWTTRIAIPSATIEAYLTGNIHYLLDYRCREAIREFRRLAAQHRILSPLDPLPFLKL